MPHHVTPTLVVEVADGDGLDVLVLSHTVQTTLLSVTALLDTAERRLGSADLACVGTNHTDLHLVGNTHDTADVLGEEVSGKTELCVRTECLVFSNGHLLCHTSKNGGLVEETRAVGGRAAGSDLSALGCGIGDVLLDLVDGRLVDKRSLGGGLVETTAHLQSVDLFDELGSELLSDALLDVESVGAVKILSRASELAEHSAFSSQVEVGILKDDERSVATEFQA
ncbi:hypothetical protein HG531_000491 [Fusarium graminearum]|nr:hypothetical protein HG531_000491 [Fusarium graminearum]